jgi:hypothetical protein
VNTNTNTTTTQTQNPVGWRKTRFGEYMRIEQLPNGTCHVRCFTTDGGRLIEGNSFTRCRHVVAFDAGYTSCDEPTTLLNKVTHPEDVNEEEEPPTDWDDQP